MSCKLLGKMAAMNQSVLCVGKFDADGLDKLERQLAIQTASIRRLRDQNLDQGTEDEAETAAMDTATRDVIATYGRGITIAPQAESRPLIPLFKADGHAVPAALKVDHEKMGYDFYSVEVIFTILLPKDEYASSAKFDLEITDDATNVARKTRPIQLFPERQDKDYFRADFEGAVGIDADMKLSLPLSVAGTVVPFLQLTPEAKLKAKMVVGPFSFPFRRAAIEVTGEQSQKVHWGYNLQSTLKGANTFKSMLILKVAKETTRVGFEADLQIVPCKSSWYLIRQHLPPIPVHAQLVVELAR
jgi:hypothetical protein